MLLERSNPCVYCGSGALDVVKVDITNHTADVKIKCKKCQKNYKMLYAFHAVEEVVHGVVHTDLYKVVAIYDQGMYSCSADRSNSWKVEYRKGVWVSAPEYLAQRNYGLTCFDTFSQAYKFMNKTYQNNDFMRIWECEARGMMPLKKRLSFSTLAKLATQTEINSSDIDDPLHRTMPDWPNGTMMFQQLKLKRFVI